MHFLYVQKVDLYLSIAQVSTSGVLFGANLGAAIFPEIAGIIADDTHSIRKGMWVGVGCVVGMTVIATCMPRVLQSKTKR